MSVTICPSPEQLARLARGELSAVDIDALESHILACAGCSAGLEPLVSQPDALTRAMAAEATVASHPVVIELMSTLKGRCPQGSTETPPSADFDTFEQIETDLTGFLALPQRPDEIGRLGAFRVLEILGHGGMGVVFRAEDTRLERTIAIKAMLPALAAHPTARARFLHEAKAAACVHHRHIVVIHQVEEHPVPFLTMELLEGESLHARLARDRVLPTGEVARIGREIAEGLAAAHDRGLIHRDIKPGNIWLEGERATVKILDFGLARLRNDRHHLTPSGAIIGTPAFMAPEHATGAAADHRCDLFSLGCILYRMATGERPFKGENTLAILSSLANVHPLPPAKLDARVPRELSDLIMHLLEKDPAKRTATAQEVVARLRRIEAAPAATVPASLSRARKIAAFSLAALLGLSLLGIVTAGFLLRVETEHGTLHIDIDDPAIEVVIKQGGAIVSDQSTKRQFQVRPGPGIVEVFEKNGVGPILTRAFTLNRGGARETVSVRMADVPRNIESATAPFALEFEARSRVESTVMTRFPEEACTYEAWATIASAQGTLVKGPNSYLGFLQGKPIFYTFHGDVRSPRLFEPGRRVHLAGVNEGKMRRIYVDGKLQAETAGKSQLSFKDMDHPVCLGGDGFEGTIEMVRISTNARYRQDFPPPATFVADKDTLALYRFDEGQGDVLRDRSGYGLHGKILGARWVTPTKTPAPGPSPAKSAEPSVDLMPLIDVSKDVLGGEWKREGNAFVAVERSVNSILRLPAIPGDEYTVRVKFSTNRGNVAVLLPIDDSAAQVWISGGRVLLASDDGRLSNPLASEEMPFLMYDGKQHLLTVEVARPTRSHVRITASVDGVRGLVWQGPVARAAQDKKAKMTQNGLAFTSYLTVSSPARLLEASLTVTKGTMKLLRPPTPPPAAAVSQERAAAEAVLTAGGTIWADLHGRSYTRVGDLPSGPFPVSRVQFTAEIVALGARSIAMVAPLQPAWIDMDAYDPAAVAALATSPVSSRLDHLEITKADSDAVFDDIARISSLRTISFSRFHFNGTGLTKLRNLPNLDTVDLIGGVVSISPSGMAALAALPNLKNANLDSNTLNVDHVRALAECKRLTHLNINSTKLADDSMPLLARIATLQKLGLNTNPITGSGLAALNALPNLRELDVRNSKVTAGDVERFRKALPKCKVDSDFDAPSTFSRDGS